MYRERGLVRRGPLVLALGVVRLECRQIGHQIVPVVPIAARFDEADHADADVLIPDGAPEPRAIAQNRPADFAAVVLDVLNRIARAGALRLQLGRDVVALDVVVHHVEARRAAEPVAAALRDEIDRHPARLHRCVAAAGLDLNFLEGVEVVIQRGRRRGHVGDVAAVHVPHLVAARAVRNERCLLP